MTQFTVSHLRQDQIPEAFPLIRMAEPEVSFECWAQFVNDLMNSGGGILAVSTDDGKLHGLATYRIDRSLRHGQALQVDDIVTFELSRLAPARRVLCEALDTLAEKLGCTNVALVMGKRGYADTASPKAQEWHALGHNLDAVIFAKKLHRSSNQNSARPARIARKAKPPGSIITAPKNYPADSNQSL